MRHFNIVGLPALIKALFVPLVISMMFAVTVPAFASSHREAPSITLMPGVDGTDFYMFRSYEP